MPMAATAGPCDAFGFCKDAEAAGDGVADGVTSSFCGVAQPVLQLGESLLNRVEAGRVPGWDQ